VRQWEKTGLQAWNFGDLPEKVLVEELAGAEVLAYPGLEVLGESVNVCLYKNALEAGASTSLGIRKLVEWGIGRDLADISKELLNAARKMQTPKREGRSLANPLQRLAVLGTGRSAACSPEAFQTAALRRVLDHAFVWEPVHPLDSHRFETFLETGRRALPGLVYQLVEWTRQALAQREELQSFPKRYKGMEVDLERLVPANVPEHTPFAQMKHLARYLNAIRIRAERAALKPAKDAEKAAQLAQFEGWSARVVPGRRESFRWLLEEFRVSLFAQELGTAETVSAQRLKALMEE
jgi:ATP-dependent helicase HrpA